MTSKHFIKLAAAVTRPLLALSAALLLLSLVPAGASAYMSPGGEPVADSKVAAWLGIARMTWGRTPDCPEGVRLDRAERISGPGTWAAAEMPGCQISLDPDFYPAPAIYASTTEGLRHWEAQMCNVIVHEWGHLLGHDHVADSWDVMAATAPLVVSACWRSESAPATTAAKTKKPLRASTRAQTRRKAAARRLAAKRSSRAVSVPTR